MQCSAVLDFSDLVCIEEIGGVQAPRNRSYLKLPKVSKAN